MQGNKKKYPCYLPGKEIWNIHYSPLAAWNLPTGEKLKELEPLAALAEKKGWIREKKELLALVEKGEIKKIWEAGKEWGTRIAWPHAEESAAGAGWLLLKNWMRAQTKKSQFDPPCKALRGASPEQCLEAMDFYPKESEDQIRLMLAVILRVLHPSDLSLEGFGRDCVGSHAIGLSRNELYRLISHGTPTQNGWKNTPISKVKEIIALTGNQLPEGWKTAIRKKTR